MWVAERASSGRGEGALSLEMTGGRYWIRTTDLTVAEYLRTYHAEHARHHSAARSHESSGYLLEAHIIPGLGGYKLSKLRPADLQRYYAAQTHPSRAPSSVRKDHDQLHSAFKHAVMMQLLATDPADFVVPPLIVRNEMKILDETQAAAMLHAAEGTSLHMALLLAVGTGMRHGELLGLRWSDVDPEAAAATVNQTLQEAYGKIVVKEPKTAKSRRRITLPTSSLTPSGPTEASRRGRRSPTSRTGPTLNSYSRHRTATPGDRRTSTRSGGA